MEIFKERLREEIINSKKSRKEIAEQVGVSTVMITEYCTTKKLPSLENFKRLCEVLDVSPNYLLGFKDY